MRTSLRRAHKDSRARKHLLAISFLMLIPFLCCAYLAWLIGSGAIFFLPFAIPVLWWIRRSNKLDDPAGLSIVPPAPPVQRALSEAERGEIRSRFARMALAYAVFVDRAASESFLKKNGLPSGTEATARRVHLDVLKRTATWDRLAQSDRDALIDADGQWDWERINWMALAIEPLRVLRWILRLDFYLPVVGHQLELDAKIAHELVNEPEKLTNGTDLRSVATMEMGRDAARHYVLRCYSELVSRGCETAVDEKTQRWAKAASAQFSGKQSEDLLLDGKLVSEADEDQIRWALALARRRAGFLQWTIEVVEGARPLGAEFAPICLARRAAELTSSSLPAPGR